MLNDSQFMDAMFPDTTPKTAPETLFRIAIDPIKLKEKPADTDKVTGGKINSSLAKIENQQSVTLKQLGSCIASGQSFCVAELDGNGRKETNFKSSQIIAIDIDNKIKIEGQIKKVNITKEHPFYLSLSDAIKLFNTAGININAWYHSFSHTTPTEKFRLLILLDKPIKTNTDYRKLYSALLRFCPQIDTAAQDPTRLFFGSNNFTMINETPSSFNKILSVCPPEPVVQPLPPKPVTYTVDINEATNTTAEAVKFLYNTISGREQWRNYGLAIAELGESGRNIFADLSLNQAGYSDTIDYINRVYDDLLKSWKPGGLTYKTIIAEAQKNGFVNPAKKTTQRVARVEPNTNERALECLSLEEKKATDYTIAKILHNANDGNFIYNHPKKTWFYWNGKHWEEDSTGAVKKSILQLSQKVLKQAAETTERDLQEKLLNTRKDLENAKNWTGYLTVYSTISGSNNGKFNQESNMLFNLNNGTFDFNKMHFREHRKNDYLTECLPYEYNPHAECPRWISFLDDCFAGNQELVNFIQKAIGYTMTGLATEQHFFFLYGTGSNGKSVFIETALSLLDGYSVKIPLTALLQSKNQTESAREIIRLQGKRIAVSNEVDEGGRLAESTIKDLTGGDTLTGKRLYEDTVTFKPTHKLWIYGNHKPVIKGTDPGIWRRPLLVPFTITVPPEKKDPDLISKLRKELPGIFNWALTGLATWKEQGLKPIPNEITVSTAEYRSAMDLIGNFLSECTETALSVNTNQKELYTAFKQWQIDSGDNSRITSNKLTIKLTERGLSSFRGGGNVLFWSDLRII